MQLLDLPSRPLHWILASLYDDNVTAARLLATCRTLRKSVLHCQETWSVVSTQERLSRDRLSCLFKFCESIAKHPKRLRFGHISIDIEVRFDAETALKILPKLTHVTQLEMVNVEWLTGKNIKIMSKKLPALTDVIIADCGDGEILTMVVSCWPKLKSFDLVVTKKALSDAGSRLMHFNKKLSAVERYALSFDGAHLGCEPQVVGLLKNTGLRKKLRELRLGMECLTDEALNLIPNFDHLEKLEFCCQMVKTAPAFLQVKKLKKLKHLHLNGGGVIEEEWLANLFRSASFSLRFLRLSDLQKLTNSTLESIISGQPSLEVLAIVDPGLLTDDGLGLITNLKKLRVLSLTRVPKLRSFLDNFRSDQLPCMKHVRVVGCDFHLDNAVPAYRTKLPRWWITNQRGALPLEQAGSCNAFIRRIGCGCCLEDPPAQSKLRYAAQVVAKELKAAFQQGLPVRSPSDMLPAM